MREKWTDERLDDLNHYVRDGFDRIDKDLRALRAETNARFDSLQRTLLQLGGGMLITFVVGFASLLVTQG